jgi:hypothetical protein
MKLPKLDIRWLYVFYTFSHLFRFKVGIAKDVEQRRASVEASMSSALNRRVKIRSGFTDDSRIFFRCWTIV